LHTADDVLKLILAGADVTMLASALIQHGPGYLSALLDELTENLERRGVASIDQVRGLASKERCANPAAYERANYAKALAALGGGTSPCPLAEARNG
jgi:dihydroorotate dehydrogenase (fumarate)